MIANSNRHKPLLCFSATVFSATARAARRDPTSRKAYPVEYAGFDFRFRRAAVVGAMERPRLFVLSSDGGGAELRFGAVQEAMAVRTELADLRAERADLRVKCSELARELDAMRAELADLRAERADLGVKCSELASQLDAMRAEL